MKLRGKRLGLLNLFTNRVKMGEQHEIIEEFHPLYRENPEAIFITDDEENILSFNQKFTSLFGYKQRDIVKFATIFFQSSNPELVHQHFQKCLKGEKTSFEIILQHKLGNEIPLQITFIPTTKYIFVICKDMSSINTFKDELIRVNDQLEDSQRMINVGIWEYDIHSNKTYWSHQMYEIMGVQKEGFSLNWDNVLTYVHSLDKKIYRDNFQKIKKEKKPLDFVHRITRDDGQERVLFVRTNPILDEEGEVSRIFGTLQDITDQADLEDKLNESEERFKSVSDRLSVGIWSYDFIEHKITFCSQGIESVLGISRDKIEAEPELWKKVIFPDDIEMIEKEYEKLINGQEIQIQYRIFDGNGNIKWIEGQTIPYLDHSGKIIRLDGIIRDTTEKVKYTESLAFLADHDFLTKLPNRRFFERRIDELINDSSKTDEKFAVLYLNLDRFKYINDTLGHEIGDKLLVCFSERMKDYLDTHTFFARIGGDEFSIIFNHMLGLRDAIKLANELISVIEEPFNIDDFELFITSSIGISMYPLDGQDSKTLLRNALAALYKAKESGRNDWQIFSPSMNVESFKLYHLERDLRKSLMNEELYLNFQPKVNTKTSKIVGAEALIRWNHPEWGIVSPGEFIPLAEENGFIFNMGDWVLKEVCESLGRWQKQGLPVVPVSVNVSPKRLLKTGFVRTVQETIQEAGIDPSLIELELTEQTIIKNTEATKNIIKELKALGVKIALDDFGTGYSSLSYLKDLDIDTLKIDKSFIDGITIQSMNDAIVKSLVSLSNEVGINIVAEGVETQEQLKFLFQHNCHQIQGYIYSKPVSATLYESLLKQEVIHPYQENVLTEAFEDRRKYYRLKLDYPLTAKMTIIKFKNKDVTLGSSKAIIEDMGVGGIKYVTNINLPVRSDMIIKFKTLILGKKVEFIGRNAWKFELDGVYEYGFEFILNQAEQDRLSLEFNKLLLQINENPLLPDSSILQEDRLNYLKS
ncbi:EAL domain-containing protein [Bacillus sp. PS06]|uniref:EAL domain-containing protein n=1 Tax=Bacillus sp. PS06 TaxID=2764176 RepID=UPI001783E614|nr:EAL domain-containing protein [Bacillus sp. PS06]MBD8067873.1 EAL domain-containing protein [Bacillus sp. PS06]